MLRDFFTGVVDSSARASAAGIGPLTGNALKLAMRPEPVASTDVLNREPLPGGTTMCRVGQGRAREPALPSRGVAREPGPFEPLP